MFHVIIITSKERQKKANLVDIYVGVNIYRYYNICGICTIISNLFLATSYLSIFASEAD